MSWIRSIEETEAEEELAGVYERIRRERGKLSNIMRVQSLHPSAMEAHMDLYMAIMFGRSGLSREEREMIAVVVSAANGCEHCIRHHVAALDAYWRDDSRVNRFAADFRTSDLPERMRAVLEYADLLTRAFRNGGLEGGIRHSDLWVCGSRDRTRLSRRWIASTIRPTRGRRTARSWTTGR